MAQVEAAVQAKEKLKQACDSAYDAHLSSCSHAVWHVLKAIVNSGEEYRQANELIVHMTAQWKKVTVDEAHTLANQGDVVVGGKSASPNGHVVVVYPGEKILNGGYQYFWKKGNKMMTLRGTALYPRCLSTSMGTWPGAKSKGEKTVWDPWGNDQAFADVQFWTRKAESTPTTQ